MESTARTPSTAREFQDTASPAVVSLYRVVPALMATNDGGATPVQGRGGTAGELADDRRQRKKRRRSLTEEGADEERPQRHVNDGGGDVDEPVGEKRCDPQEDDVVDQVISTFVNLLTSSDVTQFSDQDDAGCFNTAQL